MKIISADGSSLFDHCDGGSLLTYCDGTKHHTYNVMHDPVGSPPRMRERCDCEKNRTSRGSFKRDHPEAHRWYETHYRPGWSLGWIRSRDGGASMADRWPDMALDVMKRSKGQDALKDPTAPLHWVLCVMQENPERHTGMISAGTSVWTYGRPLGWPS